MRYLPVLVFASLCHSAVTSTGYLSTAKNFLALPPLTAALPIELLRNGGHERSWYAVTQPLRDHKVETSTDQMTEENQLNQPRESPEADTSARPSPKNLGGRFEGAAS